MNGFPPRPSSIPSCHDWISGVALTSTLAQTCRPYEASLSLGAAVPLRLPSHTPSRERSGSGLARFQPRAVAYDSWLPPVGPIRDLHPPPFIHARRTQSPYGLLPIPPRSLSLPTYSCVDPPPPSTLISRGEVSHRGWHRGLAAYEDIRFLREGDLLWNSTGTGTIGRVIRLIDPPERLVCDSHVTVVRCLLVSPEYIRTWLRTGNVYGLIEERAAGSTNQVELTAQMAFNQVVPLPPLAEQHRIVAKVDELMALCDRLEINLGIADTGRQHLLESLLRDVLVPSNEPRPAPKLGPFEIGHKSAT